MSLYVYQKKPLRINRRRRKEDMAKHDSSPKEKSRDRRKKVRAGIIIENYDRRQNDDKNYAGPERRSGVEKRSGKERR
jgi:hypothetical protein